MEARHYKRIVFMQSTLAIMQRVCWMFDQLTVGFRHSRLQLLAPVMKKVCKPHIHDEYYFVYPKYQCMILCSCWFHSSLFFVDCLKTRSRARTLLVLASESSLLFNVREF